MRRALLLLALAACKDAGPPSPGEIADRGWRAHEIVVAAGERESTCAAAGAAMQKLVAEHRTEFLDALALDQDPKRLAEATAYLEAHEERYADLETRMAALAERCVDDASVTAAFAQMESP